MARFNFAKITITALLLGFLAPLPFTPSAHADAPAPTITKTFNVSGANGSALSGASIFLVSDPGSGITPTTYSATTNSQGVATVNLPIDLPNLSVGVEPAESDLVNAIATDDSFSEPITNNADQTLTVRLRAASIRVRLKNSDGEATEKGISFAHPTFSPKQGAGPDFSLTARSGAFGVALPAYLNPASNYFLAPYIYQSNLYTNTNLFSWGYGLRATGSSGSQTYTVYQSKTFATTIAPTNGVYDLTVYLGNLRGQLTSGGSSLRLPSGVFGSVTIQKVNDDGTPDYSAGFAASGTHNILPDGSFPGRVYNSVAGRYKVTVQLVGSATIPSFVSYLYQDSSGRFSTTANSFSGNQATFSAPFTFNLPVPAATLAVQVVQPGGTTPSEAGNVDVYSSDNTQQVGSFGLGLDGIGSITLPNGTYTLRVNDQNTTFNSTRLYTLVVANNVVSSLTSNGTTFSKTGNIYLLPTATTNINVKLVDAVSNSPIQYAYVNVWSYTGVDDYGNEIAGDFWANLTFPDSYGLLHGVIPAGNYVVEVGTFYPDNGHGRMKYHMSVNDQGVGSITGQAAAQNGVLTLSLEPANLKILLSTTNMADPTRAFYEVCTGTDVMHANSCMGDGFDPDHHGFQALSAGTYYIRIHPRTAALAIRTYTATVDSGKNLTIAGATKDGNFWILGGATPNIKFKASNPVTNALLTDRDGNIRIDKFDSQNQYLGSLPGAEYSSSEPGLTSAKVDNGTYRVTLAMYGGSQNGVAERTYDLTVENGVATLKSGGVEVAKDQSGNYLVSFATANFGVQLLTPDGQPLQNSWFDICTDTGNGPLQTGGCFGGPGTGTNGQATMSLNPGSYYVRVQPGRTYSYASNIYHVIVASDRTVTVENTTKTNDLWQLSALTPTISGTFEDQSGTALNMNGSFGIDLQLQKWDETKRYWQWQGSQWRLSNIFGVKVTSEGKYRLMANPQGASGLTVTASDPFWILSNGNIARSESDQTGVSSISNFELRLKTPNVLFRVTDPRDGTSIPYGYINAFTYNLNTHEQMYVANANINSTSPGLAGFNFSDGTYRLEVSPQQGNTMIAGLAKKNYLVVVSNSGATVVVTPWGSQTQVSTSDNRLVLPVSISNISGRLVSPDGSPLSQVDKSYININVQNLNANGGWDWTDNWYQPDSDGYFALAVDTLGTHRLLLQVNGRPDASDTYSSQFTVTQDNVDTFTQNFGSILLNSPDLSLSVYEGETQTALTYINIEVRQGNQYITNANTTNGVASISFPDAGNYDLILHPNPEQVQHGFAAKTYHVTVTKDGSGVKTATVNTDAGATKVGTLNKLKLGTASLVGYVRLPSTNHPVVENSQVIATDSKGQELWQYSSQTSSTGKFAMALPSGTYTLQARAPYGNSDYGSTDKLGTVTIDSSGNATLSGSLGSQDPLNMSLMLKNPTWKGVVLAPSPSTDPVPYANICLVINNVWNCVTASATGTWSMSAPDGFTSFDSSSQLRVEDSRSRLYPSLIYNGADAVSGVLTPSGDLQVQFQLPSPNLLIHVTAGNGPAQYVWVNVNEQNGPWLGGNMTDANGDAKFFVDSSELTSSKHLTAMADANSNSMYALSFASTSTNFLGNASSTNFSGTSATVALATPNLHGIVNDPGTDSIAASVVTNSWVELFLSTGFGGMDWRGNSSLSGEGKFSLFAPAVNGQTTHYFVRVNPSWGSNTPSTTRLYDVTVSGSGEVTGAVVKDSNPGVAAPSSTIGGTTFYTMSLATPSVQGTVLDVQGQPIGNSWVESFDATQNMWVDGSNSRNLTGVFGMALASGTYRLQANVPWNLSGVARSAPCNVTISGGVISTGDASCVGQDKKVTLRLRAPNIKFQLKSGSDEMAYANVGIGYGAWNTNAQADSHGIVSLFVDVAAIAAANPGISGTISPYIWVNPPWNGGDKMVQWSCAFGDSTKPICNALSPVTIGVEYSAVDLHEIQVLRPNVVLHIKEPDNTTSLGQGAWVTLISFTPDGHGGANSFTWAGASTDSNGDAHFYIDTTTSGTRWGVTVDAPWNQRDRFSTKSYGTYDANGNWDNGLTWEQIIDPATVFSPATPNLAVTILRPDGVTTNRYGWISIEELNGDGNPIKGNGSGLDYYGKTGLLLGNSKHYRITAYPNGGEGTQTRCLVDTDSSGAIIFDSQSGDITTPVNGCNAGTASNGALTIALSSGNVTGQVKDDHNQALPGAIVVATLIQDTSTVVTTSTNTLGSFGLQLDFSNSNSWSITILPPGTTLANKTLVTAVSAPADLGSIALAVRQ